ncbi:ABC transporter permease [Acidobacteria bacterium AH-259-O06]|nr:ABC transporter permease [Acidobacteria bacterium AH-259-O06]
MNKTQYLENIRMGLNTLRSHPLRSFLTVLGVIIGVMTVIVISSILTGMRSNILSLVEEYGTDNIYAFHLSTGPQIGPRDRKEWIRDPLTVEDAEALKTQSDSIKDVAYWGFGWRFNSTIQYRGQTYRRADLQGASPNLIHAYNAALSEGRFITKADNLHHKAVCVLGVNVVEALFPHHQRVVGRAITIGGHNFTVVGVLEKRKATFFGENDENNLVQIPYRTFRKLSPRDDFLLIMILARSGQLQTALDHTEMILRRQRGLRSDQANDFDITTFDKLVDQFDAIVGGIGLVAIAISAVGLMVGGIGVMNIMLVSVTERTREIGVRKAIGAKRQDIASQFLFEAITLTTVGGVLGILVAILVSYVVIWFLPELPASIPIWAVITGFMVAVCVGLIFGVWPAVKASRLDPIECLRYE